MEMHRLQRSQNCAAIIIRNILSGSSKKVCILRQESIEKIFNYSEILMCRPFPFTWETMSSRMALLNLPQME